MKQLGNKQQEQTNLQSRQILTQCVPQVLRWHEDAHTDVINLSIALAAHAIMDGHFEIQYTLITSVSL